MNKDLVKYLYNVWQGMQRRCDGFSSKEGDIERYYKRGITYCERWKTWNNFLIDMYSTYQKGLWLDRIDNDKNYEPENCRWVTPKESNRNKSNTIYIEYEGKKQPLSKICEDLKVSYTKVIERYYKGIREIDKLFYKDNFPNSVKGRTPIIPCSKCGTMQGALLKGYNRPIRKQGMCNACYSKTRYQKLRS